MQPDYGDAVEVRDDELPVFWACGVTPQSVIATVNLPDCPNSTIASLGRFPASSAAR